MKAKRRKVEPMKNVLWQSLFLAVLALLPALGMVWWHPEPPDQHRVPEVTLQQVESWDVPVLWVDARGAEERQVGEVPEAIWMSESNWVASLQRFMGAWQRGQSVVVFCSGQDCLASHRVASRLRREADLDRIFVLPGGYDELKGKSP